MKFVDSFLRLTISFSLVVLSLNQTHAKETKEIEKEAKKKGSESKGETSKSSAIEEAQSAELSFRKAQEKGADLKEFRDSKGNQYIFAKIRDLEDPTNSKLALTYDMAVQHTLLLLQEEYKKYHSANDINSFNNSTISQSFSYPNLPPDQRNQEVLAAMAKVKTAPDFEEEIKKLKELVQARGKRIANFSAEIGEILAESKDDIDEISDSDPWKQTWMATKTFFKRNKTPSGYMGFMAFRRPDSWTSFIESIPFLGKALNWLSQGSITLSVVIVPWKMTKIAPNGVLSVSEYWDKEIRVWANRDFLGSKPETVGHIRVGIGWLFGDGFKIGLKSGFTGVSTDLQVVKTVCTVCQTGVPDLANKIGLNVKAGILLVGNQPLDSGYIMVAIQNGAKDTELQKLKQVRFRSNVGLTFPYSTVGDLSNQAARMTSDQMKISGEQK